MLCFNKKTENVRHSHCLKLQCCHGPPFGFMQRFLKILMMMIVLSSSSSSSSYSEEKRLQKVNSCWAWKELWPWVSDRIWVTLPSIVWKLKLFNPGARGLLCVDPETESQQDLNPSNNFRIKDLAKGLTLLRNKTLRKWSGWNAAVTIKHYVCSL